MNYLAAIKGGSSIYLTLRPHNYDIYAQIQWISRQLYHHCDLREGFCISVHQSQQTDAHTRRWHWPIRIQIAGISCCFNGLDREIGILHNIIHFIAFKKPYESKKLREYNQKNKFYHLYTILGFNNPRYSETHSYLVPNL